MTRRAVVLAASFLAITLIHSDRTSAQVSRDPSGLPSDFLTLAQPVILAGPDVGFRIVRMEAGIPTGQLVVKINGVWVTATTR